MICRIITLGFVLTSRMLWQEKMKVYADEIARLYSKKNGDVYTVS